VETVAWGAAIAVLVVLKHRGNIGRLLAGRERKLGEKAS
jgi:glycerol-3-phosphate acyltransferase PlsY